MTLAEAVTRAAALGLTADDSDGFATLRRPGGGIAARGATWTECFARLEAAQAVHGRSQRLAPYGSLPPTPEPLRPGELF